MKTAIEKEYELYKNCYELDVYNTVDKDLEDEHAAEKVRELQNQSSYEVAQKSAQAKADVETIQRMLVLYYFGPTVVVEEEKKVDG